MTSIAELIADTYRDASLAGAKMLDVARALETLHDLWQKHTTAADSYYIALGWLDSKVAETDDPSLISLLNGLRKRLSQCLLEADLSRIQDAFAHSADEGWLTWRRAFGAALGYSRFLHCIALAAMVSQFSRHVPRDVALVAQVAPLMAHESWPECYEMFCEVVHWEGIAPHHRALIAATTAQIEIYHLWDLEGAELHIEIARQLSPEEPRVEAVQGELHLRLGELEQARACFERAIVRAPDKSAGHIGLGDLLQSDTDPDPDGAEKSYRRATRCSDSGGDPYLRLLGLYKRPDWFADNEATVRDLFERALRGDPDFPVNALVTLGDVYAANALPDDQRGPDKAEGPNVCDRHQSLREKALRCYADVDAKDPERPDGLLAKGRFLARAGELEEARGCFKQALSRRNGRISAAWELALLDKTAGRWFDVTRWIERIVAERPSLRRLALPVLGEARMHLGDFDGAERTLLDALRLDAKGFGALGSLEQLSYKYARERNDLAAAIHILDEINKIRGASYEATYHNRVGVLQFEEQRYEDAAESFRQAVAKEPENSVIHSNLALACEELWRAELSEQHWVDEAIEALHEARRLDAKNPTYISRLADLERRRSLATFYGPTGMGRLPAVTPVAIEAAANLRPLLQQSGGELDLQFGQLLKDMREGLYELLGFEVPFVRVRINESDLPDGTYVLMIREIPLVSGNVVLNRGLCDSTVDHLTLLNIKSEEAVNPVNGRECSWVGEGDWQKAKDAGLQIWTPAEYIVLHLSAVVRKNSAELVGVQAIVEMLKSRANEQYSKILSTKGGLPRFTSVIQALLTEEVPIKELPSICDYYLDSQRLATCDIPEEIRWHDPIRRSILGNTPDTPLYPLGEKFVALISAGIRRDGDAAVLALEPEPTQEALTAVRNEVKNLPPTSKTPVLFVEDWRIRTFVRRLVELEFPNLAVLSRREALGADSRPVLATIEMEPHELPGKP